MQGSKKINHNGKLSLSKQVYFEAKAMAEYALSEGKQVPGSLIQTLNTFNDSDNLFGKDLKKLTEVHNSLSKIVAPAVPRAILLLSAGGQKRTLMKLFGSLPLVRQMMIIASFFLTCFIGLGIFHSVSSVGENFDETGVFLSLLQMLFILSAAGLGALFSVLFQLNRYIANLTYDPKYEVTYGIRILLGLIAGLVLADLIPIEVTKLNKFGKPLLAMLGGFSSSVVHQILERLIQAIKSLVRGDLKTIIESEKQKLQAKHNVEKSESKQKMTADLIKLKDHVSSGINKQDINKKIEKLLSKYMPTELGEDDEDIDDSNDLVIKKKELIYKINTMDEYGKNYYGKILNGYSLIEGKGIYTLQEKLKELGFGGSADGVFGKHLQSNIKNLQKSFGLSVDGIAGPNTQLKIDECLKNKENTTSNVTDTMFNHYLQMIAELSEKRPDFYSQEDINEYLNEIEKGNTVVMGLRAMMNNQLVPNEINYWNDTLLVLRKYSNTQYYIRHYKATTDPGNRSNYDGKETSIMIPQVCKYYRHLHQGKAKHYCLGDAAAKHVHYLQQPGMTMTPNVDELISQGHSILNEAVGINIHWGTTVYCETNVKDKVGNYGRGCQVFCCEDGKWAESEIYKSFLDQTYFRKDQESFLYLLADAVNFIDN